MLTSRDLEIINFLEDYRVASTSTLAKMFFPNLNTAHKRLKTLADEGVVNRARDIITAEYIYYITKPKQLRHTLLVSDFYRELSKRVKVVKFKLSPKIDYLIPDAVFGYVHLGTSFIGFLEVEISNKGLDLAKYQKFFDGDYLKHYPIKPILYVVTDRPKANNLSIRFIDTQFKRFVL